MKVLLVVVACLAVARSSELVSYLAQDEWTGSCNLESSTAQSPVDIVTPATSVEKEVIVDLPVAAQTATVANAEALTDLKFSFSDDIEFTAAALGLKLKLVQLHLHWGAEDTEGSEHQVDAKKFSAESHLVTTYTGTDDGLYYVVFARLFEVGAENAIIQKMIGDQDGTADFTELNVTTLYPSTINKVLTYNGSLTTPGCDEKVTWVVVPEALEISTAQLTALRVLVLGDGGGEAAAYTRNWRDIQATNERTFVCYELTKEEDKTDDDKDDDESSAIASYLGVLLLAPVLALLL